MLGLAGSLTLSSAWRLGPIWRLTVGRLELLNRSVELINLSVLGNDVVSRVLQRSLMLFIRLALFLLELHIARFELHLPRFELHLPRFELLVPSFEFRIPSFGVLHGLLHLLVL